MTAKVARVSLLDLTADQVEAVEVSTGLPLDKWGSAPSKMRLYKAILSAVRGGEPADYGHMSLREMQDVVDLSGEDEPPEA